MNATVSTVTAAPTAGAPFRITDFPITPGVSVIEASAGTGKTFSLAALIVRLVAEGRVESIGRILAVTFTEAATAELVDRVRRFLAAGRELAGRLRADPGADPVILAASDDERAVAPVVAQAVREYGGAIPVARRLAAALAAGDDLAIHTIHGFCKRILDQAAFACAMPFGAELTGAGDDLTAAAARDWWRASVPHDPLLAELAIARAWSPDLIADLHRLAHRLPGTRWSPAPVPLAAARRDLESAVQAVVQTWRDERDALLAWAASKAWKKDSPLSDTALPTTLAAFQALSSAPARLRPFLAIAADLAPARLIEGRNRTKHKQPFPITHAVFTAAGRCADAADAVHRAWLATGVAEVDRRMETAKAADQVMTFDDLLRRLATALADPLRGPGVAAVIQAHYDLALIDEAQDTDPVQAAIFTTAFRDRPLILIGDPKQAIYAFRGADLETYLALAARATLTASMDRNWRSAPAMVAAVGALFAGLAPLFDPRITVPVVTPARDHGDLSGDDRVALEWWSIPAQSGKDGAAAQVLDRLAEELVHLLSGSIRLGNAPLLPQHCAVLVSTHRQAQAVQDRLRAAGITAVLGSTGDVAGGPAAADWRALLTAVLDPRDAGRLRAALATPMLGFPADRVATLEADVVGWQRLIQEFANWSLIWTRFGALALRRAVDARFGTTARLAQEVGGERRLTDYRHVAELLAEAAIADGRAPAGQLAWLTAAGQDDDARDERRQLRLERDGSAVQIVTLHKSKGLEWPVVFCPFLWQAREERGPARLLRDRDGTATLLLVDSDEAEAATDRLQAQRLAEDLRLTYVALTRARERCYVAVAAGPIGRDPGVSALDWLLERPDVGSDPVAVLARMDLKQPRLGLEALVDRHPDSIRTSAVAGLPRLVAAAALPPASPLPPSPLPPPDPFDPGRGGWSVASFTAVTRGSTEERPDRDAQASAPMPGDRGVHGFAAGGVAGDCLHRCLEKARSDDETALAAVIAAELQRAGLAEAAAHPACADPAAAATEMVRAAWAAPLSGATSIAELTHQRHEFPFHLPLAGWSAGAVADILRRHGSTLAQAQAEHLDRLAPRTWRGFFTGVIDLIGSHDGRWWVVDWKSNRLAADATGYTPEVLTTAVIEHFYVLQAHSYVLALHRFLAARLPDYDYDRHIGGYAYVFLRTGAVVEDRPPRAVIAALERELLQPARIAARTPA